MADVKIGTLTLDNSQANQAVSETKAAVQSLPPAVDQVSKAFDSAGNSIEKNTTKIVAQTNEFKRLSQAIPDTTAALTKVDALSKQIAASDLTSAQRTQALISITKDRVSGILDLAKAQQLEAQGYASTASLIRDAIAAQNDGTTAVNTASAAHGNMSLRLQEVSHSARGFVDMVIAGQSPLQAFSVEATRAGSVLFQMDEGFKAAVLSSAAWLIPLTAVVAVTGGIIATNAMHAASIREVTDAYGKQGAAVGLSKSQLEDLATQASATADISIREARSIESAVLAAGQAPAAVLQQIENMSRDFAKVFTDGDLSKAGSQMAQAFNDPLAAAKSYDAQLNILSQTQLQQITDMTTAGQKTQAFGVLADALNGRLHGLADDGVGYLGKSVHYLADAVSNLLDGMGKLGATGNLAQRLAAAKDKRSAMDGNGFSLEDSLGSSEDEKKAQDAIIADLQRRLDLENQLAAVHGKQQADQASIKAGSSIAQSINPYSQTRGYIAQQAQLGTSIGALNGQIANTDVSKQGPLLEQLRQQQQEYEALGHAIDTYRTADQKASEMAEATAAASKMDTDAGKAYLAVRQKQIELEGAVVAPSEAAAQIAAVSKQGQADLTTATTNATKAAQVQADSLLRLADAAGQGDAAIRQATYANQVEAAQLQGSAAVRATELQQRTAEADFILQYTNETVAGLSAQTTANNAMAAAITQGQPAIDAAARAEFSRLQILKLGKDALVDGTKAQADYNAIMAQYDANVTSQGTLSGAQALKNESDKLQVLKDQLTIQETLQSLHGADAQNAAEIIAREQAMLDIESGRVKVADDQKQAYIDQAGQIAKLQQQSTDLTKAEQDRQRQIKQVADDVTRVAQTDIYDVLQGKSVDLVQSFKDLWLKAIADIAAQMLETKLIMPVVTAVVGSISGSVASGAASAAGSSGIGGLIGSAGTSAAGSVGSSYLLGGTGISGALTGAGTYLFGAAPGSIASTEAAAAAGNAALAGGATASSASASAGAIDSAGTSGLLGSAGAVPAYIPFIGWMMAATAASTYLGTQFGQANKNSSPVERYLEGNAIGGEVTGLNAIFPYALTGHPTVGPNSNANSIFANGQFGVGTSGADNGGSAADSTKFLTDAVTGLNTLASTLGVTIKDIGNIEVGTFQGQYYVKQPGASGGPGVGASTSYATEDEAVIGFMKEVLNSGGASGLNSGGQLALKNSTATDAATFASDIQFGQQFDAEINAMKTGVTDFTQAAQAAAQTTAGQLVDSIEAFKQKTQELGLSTDAAAGAATSAVESFLGFTTSQAPSQMEQDVETLYGKLQGITGLLSEVGISEADATAKVKQQVEVMLGISQATPALGTYATQLESVKETFANLAPVLSGLDISASDVAKGLAASEAAITKSANDNIMSQLDQLTGGIDTSLSALVTTFQSTFADLQAVGGNMANAQELMALQIADLYKPETTAAIQSVTDAYNTQITAEGQLGTTAAKTAQDIQTFLASLGAGSLSDGDPKSQLDAAKAAFDKATTDSNSADPTVAANAQGQLTGLAQQYLTASRAYNASGSGYTTDFNYVQQQLQKEENTATSQAAIGQEQVTLLQQQLAAATGTQTNTLTIAEAIQNLNTVMANVNASIASSIAAAGGGAYGGSVSVGGGTSGGVTYNANGGLSTGQLIASIGSDYTSLLGRQGSGDEVAYYVQQAQSGVSLQQIQQDFLNSPEYLASHSHANGGVASGWSMVGERGPEPVYFGQPAKVFTNESFRSAISSGNNDNSGMATKLQAVVDGLASLTAIVAGGAVQTVSAVQEGTRYAAQTARYTAHAAAQPKAQRG